MFFLVNSMRYRVTKIIPKILMNFASSTVSALVVDKKFSSRRYGSAYYDLGDLRSQAGSGDSDSI